MSLLVICKNHVSEIVVIRELFFRNHDDYYVHRESQKTANLTNSAYYSKDSQFTLFREQFFSFWCQVSTASSFYNNKNYKTSLVWVISFAFARVKTTFNLFYGKKNKTGNNDNRRISQYSNRALIVFLR